jgi:hypothetical protein
MSTADPNLHRFFHKKETADDYLAERVAELRSQLARLDPDRLATNTGADLLQTDDGRQVFALKVWGRQVHVTFPEFTTLVVGDATELDPFMAALLAYYFHTADGTPASGTWIAFSELPDGRFYTQAFQGYTGAKLGSVFGNNVDALGVAANSLGGGPVVFADRAFRFQVLPHVALMVACWLGDEDFPTSYRILFDAAAGHHLTTDACAIMGSVLTRQLIAAKETD